MLAAIFRIVALVRKELLAMLKDPRGRAVLFVPPVLQCIVFGYVVNYDLTRVSYVAFDRDRSAASSELLALLDGSGVFQRVANLERAVDVKTMIDARRALVAVEIDQDFERRLVSGRSAYVQVIADGRNSNTAGTALNYVRTVVDSFNAKWWAADDGNGRCPRKGGRNRRSVTGNTLSSGRAYDWQGLAVAACIPQPVDRLSAGRSALVPDSFRGLVPYALFWPYLVSPGSDRNRTSAFVAGRDHAASAARVFLDGHAVYALVRSLHVTDQYAGGYTGLRFDQSVALHDRYIAAGVP